MRRLLLAASVLPLALASAETTFNPPILVASNLEVTADPTYNPVCVRTTYSGLMLSYLGYNEASEQVLLTTWEERSGLFHTPQQIGAPAPYRTKLLFDVTDHACWIQANAEGLYEVRCHINLPLKAPPIVATFHNAPKSRPHIVTLPVGPPAPLPVWEPTVFFLDPDSGLVRIFRLDIMVPEPWWEEMSSIAINPSYRVASFELDPGGLTNLLLRCEDPAHPDVNFLYATCHGIQPDPYAPMYWTTAFPISNWILHARNEAMANHSRGAMHYTYTYDGASAGIVAYAQESKGITDLTTLTSISGSPPSLVFTIDPATAANDTIMFAGASRFGPIFQVEKVKYRARFNFPDIVPVQTLEVLNAPEMTRRAADEIPIAVQGGDRPRILLVKGNRLLLLNHSSYPIPGATPTATPSPTPSPSPTVVTATPTETPTVDSFLLLRDALIARRTPTAAQFTAGDTNGDRVWDAADMLGYF